MTAIQEIQHLQFPLFKHIASNPQKGSKKQTVCLFKKIKQMREKERTENDSKQLSFLKNKKTVFEEKNNFLYLNILPRVLKKHQTNKQYVSFLQLEKETRKEQKEKERRKKKRKARGKNISKKENQSNIVKGNIFFFHSLLFLVIYYGPKFSMVH